MWDSRNRFQGRLVKDAFVPSYRTMDAMEVMDGTAQRKAGMTETLYLMPWSTMFPLGISSAVIGIVAGALAAHLDYQRERVNNSGVAIKDDGYAMNTIGEAAADINAAARNGWPTTTRSTTWSMPARRCPSRTRRRSARPGARGVAGRVGGRRDLRPLRRQRDAHGESLSRSGIGVTRTRLGFDAIDARNRPRRRRRRPSLGVRRGRGSAAADDPTWTIRRAGVTSRRQTG